MTFFWSSWITILSIMCWAGILGVLLMVLKYKPEVEEDGTTGHTYDGIQEYDKPLPKWWLVIFFGSIIWGVAYWVLFPAIWPKSWEGITKYLPTTLSKTFWPKPMRAVQLKP